MILFNLYLWLAGAAPGNNSVQSVRIDKIMIDLHKLFER